MNFNFRGENFLIHEANVLKSDPVTLRFFYAETYSTAKAEFICETVKKFVGEFLQLPFFSFYYFSKIQSTELSIVFSISVSVANEEISI